VDYDVIVVGAGPGGSTAAYEPASRGAKVALFEQQSLPRYKPFGGCLSLKIDQILAFRLGQLSAALAVHEAAWEVASETYVLARSGRDYRRLYRKHPNPLLAVFWGGMAGLTLLGTIISLWRESSRR
jgi:2-polyprenyl-6-methoxyphenol hydroxylase-like FAD-dependent oxidoreductase